jgi:3-oxoacyl-[acyl-carrier protein] reductase
MPYPWASTEIIPVDAEARSASNPQGRVGTDGEVAELVAFLAGDAPGYLTGVTIPIDGGELLAPGSGDGS